LKRPTIVNMERAELKRPTIVKTETSRVEETNEGQSRELVEDVFKKHGKG
jgi:hypothetical protein